jgi:uncharacterized protein YkwD
MAATPCTRRRTASLKPTNPQSQLYQLLADSRSRTADIQQIRQRTAAMLPQQEQALIDRVNVLRQNPGAEYLGALEDLSNIRKSIARNPNAANSFPADL